MTSPGARFRQISCLTGPSLRKRDVRIPNERRLDVPVRTTKTLCDISGPGRIVRIWMTLPVAGQGQVLRRAVLRMFWDNEESPSVECPLGDFFGASFGEPRRFVGDRLAIVGGGYFCQFEMPFRERAIIEIENQSDKPLRLLFFQIGYYEEEHPEGSFATFHAQWRRQMATEPGKPFVAMDAEGSGRLVGVKMDIQNRCWWLLLPPMKMFFPRGLGLGVLEGPETIVIDGEDRIDGTGTEDFFNGGWYFKGGEFHTPTHGVTRRSFLTGRLSAYRFFLHDPIPFERSLHLSFDHGVANDMKSDHSSVVYWYQQEPHAAFPELPPAKERLPASAFLNSVQIVILVGVAAGLVGTAAWLMWFLFAG